MTIVNPDGAEVNEIVLPDGATASEVIAPDGSVVWSAIPDSGDLQARYDARQLSLSDGQSVSTWDDQTSNGFDLTAGASPTYTGSAINGNPVVRFDGVDDYLATSWTALSEPYHLFFVARFRTANDGTNNLPVDGGSLNEHRFGDLQGDWQLYQGTDRRGGTADTNTHVFNVRFQGSGNPDQLRIDGSQIINADSGSGSSSGLTLGAGGDGSSFFTEIDFGEFLFYPMDKQASETDIEQYLADGWGITL